VYERDFDLPDGWMGKRIVLHLGGYESVAVVFINGVEVGLTKDSRLAAEFDVTSFVKRGNNVVRIDVTKWSDATFIEDQDQWWHGGITRSVKLFATNKVFIERFYTTAGLEKDRTTGTLDIRAHIASIDNISTHNYTLRASIEELPKVKAANLESTLKTFQSPKWTERPESLKARSDEYFHGKFWHGKMPEDAKKAILENEPWPAGKIHLNTRIAKVKAWSAESPNLYTLHVELIDPDGNIVEVSQQKIGFRSIEVKGQDFLVNGQPVMFYGVNRHDFNRYTGRALTRAIFTTQQQSCGHLEMNQVLEPTMKQLQHMLEALIHHAHFTMKVASEATGWVHIHSLMLFVRCIQLLLQLRSMQLLQKQIAH
jgi:beta-galactosidase